MIVETNTTNHVWHTGEDHVPPERNENEKHDRTKSEVSSSDVQLPATKHVVSITSKVNCSNNPSTPSREGNQKSEIDHNPTSDNDNNPIHHTFPPEGRPIDYHDHHQHHQEGHIVNMHPVRLDTVDGHDTHETKEQHHADPVLKSHSHHHHGHNKEGHGSCGSCNFRILVMCVLILQLGAIVGLAIEYRMCTDTPITSELISRREPQNTTVIIKQCVVKSIKATQLSNGTKSDGMTEAEVLKFIGIPRFVTITRHHWSCIDGRDDNKMLATPGGDAAEFMSAFAQYVIISSTPNDMSYDRMKKFWYGVLENLYLGRRMFFMHTDEHTVEKIAHEIGVDHLNLTNPDPHHIPLILPYLQDGNYHGCGHIAQMFKNPDIYRVPGTIMKNFMVLFFRTMWGLEDVRYKGTPHLSVLSGQHEERAVVMMTHWGCPGMAPVPSVAGEPYIFGVNPEDIFRQREMIVEVFRKIDASVPEITLLGNMNVAAQYQTQHTITVLAGNQPMYDVTIVAEFEEDYDD